MKAEIHENGGITPGGITPEDIARNKLVQVEDCGIRIKKEKSLRDEFAMAALPVIMAGYNMHDTQHEEISRIATKSYEVADAMLKERLK